MLTFTDTTPRYFGPDYFGYSPEFRLAKAPDGWSVSQVAEIVTLLLLRQVDKDQIFLMTTGVHWTWCNLRFRLDAHSPDSSEYSYTLTIEGEEGDPKGAPLTALAIGWEW